MKESNKAPIIMNPFLYDQKNDCCGCAACYAICPVGAIEMEPDEEGFFYPIINATKCIGCLGCIKVCAFKIDSKKKGISING